MPELEDQSTKICPDCGAPFYAGHAPGCPASQSDQDDPDLAASPDRQALPPPGGPYGPDDDEMRWDYTRVLRLDAMRDGRYGAPDENAPQGYFLGRPIIARDTRISGGVYTTGEWEALVVDEKYGVLPQCFNEVLSDIQGLMQNCERTGQNPEKFILNMIFRYAERKLHYDNPAVERHVNSLRGGREVVKITIDDFIRARIGVCRHQAILAGYLIEKLIDIGYLSGKVSVDRNLSSKDGHAWVRYVTKSGEITILDAAQHFCGNIKETKDDRLRGIYRWSYERPDDDV